MILQSFHSRLSRCAALAAALLSIAAAHSQAQPGQYPNSSRLPPAFGPAPRAIPVAPALPKNPAPAQPESASAPAVAAVAPVAFPPQAGVVSGAEVRDNYVLSANDVIQVQVFQEPDLSTTTRVSQDGTVTFPLIGRVSVSGLSPQAAASTIQELLGKDFLVNPQVSITVTEYAKRRFTVLGQVQKPGSYDMPDRDNLPLLSAIGMAGGYTRIADPSRITVKRRQNREESVIRLNGKRMASGQGNTSFDVLPGDIISVGESLF